MYNDHNADIATYVTLENKDGEAREYRVDYLVWHTFKGPIPPGSYLEHINHNMADNSPANLRLVTPRKNKEDEDDKKDEKLR